jgi:hypothetical protein
MSNEPEFYSPSTVAKAAITIGHDEDGPIELPIRFISVDAEDNEEAEIAAADAMIDKGIETLLELGWLRCDEAMIQFTDALQARYLNHPYLVAERRISRALASLQADSVTSHNQHGAV